MRILHVASFNGNIGDNANHKGFYKSLKDYLKINIDVTQVEIRKFYKSWNLKRFDKDFADEANKYDLVVIGGGNFFELWLEDSETGTTIDISQEVLDMIKTPILFNCLGVDHYKGYSEKTKNNFRKFLQYLLDSRNNKRFLVSVRNDGSRQILDDLYGKTISERIISVPDPGFYIRPEKYDRYPELSNYNKTIAINVAKDMLEKRFGFGVTFDDFTMELANILNKFLDKYIDYQIVFIPHIYSDLGAIDNVVNKIKDTHRRYRIKCAPYLTGNGSEDYIFGLYAQCDLTLGMRFHSNVCCIGQNIPTIGMISYAKHGSLYEEIGMKDRMLYVNKKGFETVLEKMLYETIDNLQEVKERYVDVNISINEARDFYFNTIKSWLGENSLVTL